MTDDLDDLFGPSTQSNKEPVKRRIPRKVKKSDIIETIDDGNAPPDISDLADGEVPNVANFHRPVGISFLAKVMDTTERVLIRKLARCPVVARHVWQGESRPLYDFKTALQYIVEPKLDIATWIKGQNAASLPNHINKTFWEGMNAKLRYMAAAKHLWHDNDVLEVLGRTAMIIKETSMLWIENLPGKADLTTEQYNALMSNVVELMDDIHDRLTVQPKLRKTESFAASTEDELAEIDMSTDTE